MIKDCSETSERLKGGKDDQDMSWWFVARQGRRLSDGFSWSGRGKVFNSSLTFGGSYGFDRMKGVQIRLEFRTLFVLLPFLNSSALSPTYLWRMNSLPLVVVIVGPTAVGKTALSIKLAQEFNTEIISADSRQIYREMEVGTAKPSSDELAAVPHHLINSHSIEEVYNAGQFAEDAEKIISHKLQGKEVVIMVGGSGLYVRAFCDGLDEMPEVPAEIRDQLNRECELGGLEPLLRELKEHDFQYFEQVDQNNPQRVIRALEVIRSTGQAYSEFRNSTSKKERAFPVLKIGLEMDRSVLYERIDQRMDLMIEQGLFDEAKGLFDQRHLNSLQTVGYQEIFGYLEGKYDKEEAIRLLKRNSRRYAKRQMTWFKRDEEIQWFETSEYDRILDVVMNYKASISLS